MLCRSYELRGFHHFSSNQTIKRGGPTCTISERSDLLLKAELVSKTTDADSRHIGWLCRQTTSDSLRRHGEFQMKRSYSLQNRKYRFCFCGVPVFRSAICLSAGFSLFNQSNMKQEIWSLPRDVHPSEAAGKTAAQLSRAPRLSEAGATSAPLVEWRGILGL